MTNKKIDIFDEFPFLEAFPFDQYFIELDDSEYFESDDNISKILLENIENFDTGYMVRFQYLNSSTKLVITLTDLDIFHIYTNSNNILKMDQLAKNINLALEDSSIDKKISVLLETKEFMKKLKLKSLLNPPYQDILVDYSNIHSVNLSSPLKSSILKLKINNTTQLTKNEKIVVFEFLNFMLHFSNIILGIVIASKIH